MISTLAVRQGDTLTSANNLKTVNKLKLFMLTCNFTDLQNGCPNIVKSCPLEFISFATNNMAVFQGGDFHSSMKVPVYSLTTA